MIDKNKSNHEREQAEKLFKTDVKKHIDDISKNILFQELLRSGDYVFTS